MNALAEHLALVMFLFGACITALLTVVMFMVRKLDRMLTEMNGSVRKHGEELAEHRTQLAALSSIANQEATAYATCQAFAPWRKKLMDDYELVPKAGTSRTRKR